MPAFCHLPCPKPCCENSCSSTSIRKQRQTTVGENLHVKSDVRNSRCQQLKTNVQTTKEPCDCDDSQDTPEIVDMSAEQIMGMRLEFRRSTRNILDQVSTDFGFRRSSFEARLWSRCNLRA